MLAEFRHYSRMAMGLAKTMRLPVPADPEAYLRRSLENREASFLDVVQRVIFARAEHPYHAMLQLAGCEFGDLEAMVRRDGLETSLANLRREGVFLTHNEFKGRTPIVRGGREIPATLDSFTNPLVRGGMESLTSGSSGQPVRTAKSAEARIHNSAYGAIKEREFELRRKLSVSVRPILPSTLGLKSALRARRSGIPVDRWFSPGSASGSRHYRLLTNFMLLWGNAMGARAPRPVYLPHNDFLPVAKHVARRRAEGHDVVVHGFASPLVRVAGAAVEHGLDIAGTLFMSGGEALTPGKLRMFEAAGARAYTGYAISELTHIGMPCQALRGNTVHLVSDSIAAIVYRRASPYAEGEDVDSLHFTTLLPHAPRVLINVEMDDAGELQPAACDCTFSRLGFRTLVTNIASFGKMSPQGVTLYGTDLERILEEELPARLGGGPGDYQLVECEAANQQTQLRLYVSPRVGLTDTRRASEILMQLIRPRWGGALAARHLPHSGGLETVVAEPFATRTGKVHPVKLLGAVSWPQEAPRA